MRTRQLYTGSGFEPTTFLLTILLNANHCENHIFKNDNKVDTWQNDAQRFMDRGLWVWILLRLILMQTDVEMSKHTLGQVSVALITWVVRSSVTCTEGCEFKTFQLFLIGCKSTESAHFLLQECFWWLRGLENSLYTSADAYQGLIRTVCLEGPQIPYWIIADNVAEAIADSWHCISFHWSHFQDTDVVVVFF